MSEPRASRSVTEEADRRSGMDRRSAERRSADIPVVVDRRNGADRRQAERRRHKRSAWRARAITARKHPTPGESVPPIRAAAARVAAEWANEYGDAVSLTEVSDILTAIVNALTGPLPTSSTADPRLRSVLGRRLLELYRAAIISHWSDGKATPSSSEVLETLHSLEAVRAAIDPDWRQHFASRLSGPDGLALVVEVAHDLRSPSSLPKRSSGATAAR
jgi:hypothetical protein